MSTGEQTIESIERPIQNTAQLAEQRVRQRHVFLPEERRRHDENDESTRQRAGRVTQVRQLIREDHDARGQSSLGQGSCKHCRRRRGSGASGWYSNGCAWWSKNAGVCESRRRGGRWNSPFLTAMSSCAGGVVRLGSQIGGSSGDGMWTSALS